MIRQSTHDNNLKENYDLLDKAMFMDPKCSAKQMSVRTRQALKKPIPQTGTKKYYLSIPQFQL